MEAVVKVLKASTMRASLPLNGGYLDKADLRLPRITPSIQSWSENAWFWTLNLTLVRKTGTSHGALVCIFFRGMSVACRTRQRDSDDFGHDL